MKFAQLFHNPGAGSGEHDIDELQSIIKSNGFECHYTSVKEEGWDQIQEGVDFIIIAGGDGTVKKVARMLLQQNIKLPVALLPLGTANNVAEALQLKGKKDEDIIRSWQNNKRLRYDAGKVSYADQENFFFESFGFGIFPYFFVKATREKSAEPETPEQSKFVSLKKLEQVIPSYQPVDCHIIADEKDHSGNYFSVEIMLTRSMGPNVVLSPHSDLNDGYFDLALLAEKEREAFACQVSDKLNDKNEERNFTKAKVKQLTVHWAGCDVHIDDEVIELIRDSEVKIEILPGALEFLVF